MHKNNYEKNLIGQLAVPKQYVPSQNCWIASNLFASTKSNEIVLSSDARNQYREFLLCDLRAESDSHNLYKELKEKYHYTNEFTKFLDAWYIDETNHAAGFRRIIHLLFGDDEDELQAQMRMRVPDFSKLQHFFEDEFKLCILFAYDEHASTMTYRRDTFYRDFGPPEFVEWITRLASDEARHFGNAVRLIHYAYKDRIIETRDVINEILHFENLNESYQATFLFDHDGEHFLLSNDELNNQCAERVFNAITRL